MSPMRIVLFAVLLWLVCPNVAHACTCLGPEPTSDADFQALVDEADAVFEGRPAQSRWEGDSLVYPFEVLRSFKGPQEDSVTIDSGDRRVGRTYTTEYTTDSCTSVYEEGRTYLVFAYAGDSGLLYSGVCSPTRLSREADRYFQFLEAPQAESAPPPLQSPSGCRVSTRAPAEFLAFALVMLLGVQRRRSTHQRSRLGLARR